MNIIKNISIAITSYNRPQLLRKTLKSIGDLNLYIHVVIIDDNSPRQGEIENVISEFKFSNLNIKYYKNDKNIGEVESKKRLFSLIETEYFFLLGDDDTLNSSAANFFLDIDGSGTDCDFVFSGYREIDEKDCVLKTRYSYVPISSKHQTSSSLKIFSRFVTFPFYYCHPALYLARTSSAKQLSLDNNIGIGEDFDLLWRILNDPEIRWRILPDLIMNWRKHAIQAANQSSNLQNRFETKRMILEKYECSETPLSRFWFVLLPTYFDLPSGLKLDNLKSSPCEKKLLLSSSNRFVRGVLFVLYSVYKVLEYLVIQFKFAFL